MALRCWPARGMLRLLNVGPTAISPACSDMRLRRGVPLDRPIWRPLRVLHRRDHAHRIFAPRLRPASAELSYCKHPSRITEARDGSLSTIERGLIYVPL